MTDDASTRADILVDPRRRVFGDGAGRIWEVRETRMAEYDRRGGSCLIFESIEVMRRVRTFPRDWHSLSDAELVLLSESR